MQKLSDDEAGVPEATVRVTIPRGRGGDRQKNQWEAHVGFSGMNPLPDAIILSGRETGHPNRAYIRASIRGIQEAIDKGAKLITVVTTLGYLKSVIENVESWRRASGWRNSNGEPANLDLVVEVYELKKRAMVRCILE